MKTPSFWTKTSGVSSLLEPIGMLYGLAGRVRFALARPHRASVPVICVGNIVAGGAGKTPIAIAVAERLQAHGKTVHFLTRGYGGNEHGPLLVDVNQHTFEQVGDEPLLLARTAPTWVARDRVKGAEAAVVGGAEILVMDDGFQNPTLIKDLSLVVVDGGFGFGNRRLLPAGPLREPLERGLARASGVVVLGRDRVNVGEVLPPTLPRLTAWLRPGLEAESLVGRNVVAFAGIGRPDKFLSTLKDLGARIMAWHPFADHYPYAASDIQPILDEAYALHAVPVTTAKDAVRLPKDQRQQVTILTVKAVWDNEEPLTRLLEPFLSS